MAQYDIEALHAKILTILATIDQVCKTHNLTYFIWAGTQLGAVRHKGFIPWDDDIDIAMPRNHYEQLIAHCKEWLPQPYEFVCAENDSNYPLPFGKIQDASTTLIERLHLKYLGGVYIDVFPIDGVPDGWARKWQFAKYQFYKRVLYLLHRDPYKHGHGPSSWVPLLCRNVFSMTKVQQKIRKILTQYNYDNCNKVADYDDGINLVFDKAVLEPTAQYVFENTKVMGVAQANAYLSKKYGNYMKLPEKEKQKQHNFNILDLEHSYKDFNDNNL